jgi:hypothetical protein
MWSPHLDLCDVAYRVYLRSRAEVMVLHLDGLAPYQVITWVGRTVLRKDQCYTRKGKAGRSIACTPPKQAHGLPSYNVERQRSLRLTKMLCEGLGMYCARIKVCGVRNFSQSALRDSMQHLCVVQ